MIELVTTWDAIVNAFGAAIMLAFGVWVWTLQPRTRSTRLLAVFAVAGGAVYLPSNLVEPTGWHLYALYNPYHGAVLLVGGLALLGLARELLAPLEGRSRRFWQLALAVTLGTPALAVGANLPEILGLQGSDFGPWEWASYTFAYPIGQALFFAGFLGLALALARRYRHPPMDDAETVRTQAVLITAALVLWPAFSAGRQAGVLASPSDIFSGFAVASVISFAGFLAVAGLWLANSHAVPDRSREGRNLALLTLGMMLIGLLQGIFLEPIFAPVSSGPLWGLLRLATVVVLGYAILQHEILGVEAKFRWGVSKTTVAGVFIAVFFAVSEAAQVVFADVAGGNELLGVAAAGLLVFFLAPIQRAADEIAEAVVPGGRLVGDGAEARYRGAVEMALADDEVSRDEERNLRELEEELDLAPTRAQEIREQVEDEVARGDEA